MHASQTQKLPRGKNAYSAAWAGTTRAPSGVLATHATTLTHLAYLRLQVVVAWDVVWNAALRRTGSSRVPVGGTSRVVIAKTMTCTTGTLRQTAATVVG